LLAASGDSVGALAQLRQGLQRFPYSRALSYALTQTLMDAGRVTEGMAMITEQIRLYPRDPQLLALRARGFAMQGKRLLQHQTLAEYQVLQGNLALAVEQLQLAQTAGDGDFYELSVVDARLKQLRALLAAEMKQRRDSR
jgi:predicted Zn-dependent protease